MQLRRGAECPRPALRDHRGAQGKQDPRAPDAVQGCRAGSAAQRRRVRSRIDAFTRQYDEEFGADAALVPRNLVDTRQMEITTEDVTIRVSAARSDLVETKLLDGVPCIVIRAEGKVEIDGVPIHIS